MFMRTKSAMTLVRCRKGYRKWTMKADQSSPRQRGVDFRHRVPRALGSLAQGEIGCMVLTEPQSKTLIGVTITV